MQLQQGHGDGTGDAGGHGDQGPLILLQLPRAVLRFKQGIGRLIRSAEDSGRIVILDPRIVTKFYGKRFMAALPDGVEPEVVTADL